jgi:hypothetical protein
LPETHQDFTTIDILKENRFERFLMFPITFPMVLPSFLHHMSLSLLSFFNAFDSPVDHFSGHFRSHVADLPSCHLGRSDFLYRLVKEPATSALYPIHLRRFCVPFSASKSTGGTPWYRSELLQISKEYRRPTLSELSWWFSALVSGLLIREFTIVICSQSLEIEAPEVDLLMPSGNTGDSSKWTLSGSVLTAPVK